MGEESWERAALEELLRTRPHALVELILQQREMLAQQARTIAALEERVRQLEEALRQSGGGGSGAAPFRREAQERKADPKRPGRAPGHRGEFRAAPEEIDQTIEVALEQCPACGGELTKTTPLVQTIIELPEVRPLVVRLITHRACCPPCARRVQSTHPLQVSAAGRGVAGTQLGGRGPWRARPCCGMV